MDVRQFLRSCYGLLLNSFPKTYREDYGEELQTVFNLSLDDAMKLGMMDVAGVLLHELISLLKAIVHEHLRERRRKKMTGKFASRSDFVPGSWTEAFAALATDQMMCMADNAQPIHQSHLPTMPNRMPIKIRLPEVSRTNQRMAAALTLGFCFEFISMVRCCHESDWLAVRLFFDCQKSSA